MKQSRRGAELPLDQLNSVLELLLPLPRPWLLAAGSVLLLSMIDVGYSGQEGWSFAFGIKPITAVMFGLIWLPVLLRILAVSGGGIKTGAGEANTPGLISLLPKLIATLDSVEPTLDKAEQAQVAAIRQEAEQEWGAFAVSGEMDARNRLQSLAREYEEVRRVMPSGSDRTFRLREIAARIRSMAAEAHYSPSEIWRLFSQGSEGLRIASLEMLHRHPYPECFSLVVDAISQPRSAFEQFSALKTAEKMLPAMTSDQMEQLRQVIVDQRSGGPGRWITKEERSRWNLS
ncbi:MAG TPA: hypothetical protein V6D06_05320, partial [Trichocoleus sp.]